MARGNVNFSDLYIKPNYSANLTDVAGRVTALSAEQAGDVTMSARVDHSAPVEVQGRLHPFAKELSLDITAKARNIDLPPLTPYAGKYAGYGIEKGQLTFDVRYQVEKRKLVAENRLVLDQLQFGARVESPTATKLPVLLAVALLKDSRGVIDIRLPIAGSLDDPQFSVGDIIIQIIINLITKVATAPFALLSSLFGGGEELSTLPFAPGSAALGTDTQRRIDTLGKALLDRPALKLDIAGHADPVTDREALRHAAVQAAMRREKMKALVAQGTAPASVDQVAIDDGRAGPLARRRLSRGADSRPAAKRDRHAEGPAAGRDGSDAARETRKSTTRRCARSRTRVRGRSTTRSWPRASATTGCSSLRRGSAATRPEVRRRVRRPASIWRCDRGQRSRHSGGGMAPVRSTINPVRLRLPMPGEVERRVLVRQREIEVAAGDRELVAFGRAGGDDLP